MIVKFLLKCNICLNFCIWWQVFLRLRTIVMNWNFMSDNTTITCQTMRPILCSWNENVHEIRINLLKHFQLEHETDRNLSIYSISIRLTWFVLAHSMCIKSISFKIELCRWKKPAIGRPRNHYYCFTKIKS